MRTALLSVAMAFLLMGSTIAFAQAGPTGDVTVPTTYWHAIAGFANTTPVADGAIGAGEYNAVPLEVTKALLQGAPATNVWTFDDTTYSGDADWSMKIYYTWDWTNIYIAYDVTDDVLHFTDNWDAQWNSAYYDKFQFLYDLYGALSYEDGGYGMFKIDGVWFLAGGRSDGATSTVGQVINYGRGDWEGSAAFGSDGAGGPGSWTCVAAAKTGGYIIEMIVPWAKFAFSSTNGTSYSYTPALNNRIGIAFQAYDSDGTDDYSFELVGLTNSTAHIGNDVWADAPNFADVVLGGVTIPGGPVVVPDVSAMNQADATAALEAAGYVVAVEQEASDTVAAGGVIRTEPASGTALAEGETVTLVISTGSASDVPAAGLMGLVLLGGVCVAGATAKLRKRK